MQFLQTKELTSCEEGKTMSKCSFCFYYWKQILLPETAIKSSIESESGYPQRNENGEHKMHSYTWENYVMHITVCLPALKKCKVGSSKWLWTIET